ETDYVRQVVVKISHANGDAILPKLLPDTDVPPEIAFRFQSEIVPENFVLTARRTESRRHAGMQRRVCLVDLVPAREAVCPDAAELIEVIETSTRDKNQIFDRR